MALLWLAGHEAGALRETGKWSGRGGLRRADRHNLVPFKLALSDGTFGPRGTVFVWSCSMRQYGFPSTNLPPGYTHRNWEGETRDWKWFEARSEVGQWAGFSCATAGAVGSGRLVAGGACEGLLVISRRQPGDRGASEASERGREFRNRGLNLLYGHFGFGYYGLPLPLGGLAQPRCVL